MFNSKFDILELIYPNICGMCGKVCKESLCSKCLIDLNKITINARLEIRDGEKKYFNYGIGIFKYDKIIRQKIIDYKFNDKAYLYKTFAKIILKNKKICGNLKKYDIIIPVPIHKQRRRQRGYNQAELIARQISKELPIIFLKNVLVKQKNTISQTTLTRDKRQENVKDAFKLENAEIIKGKKIIIFDDIYTTGSTINECSKLLKQAQAKSICVITIAKD